MKNILTIVRIVVGVLFIFSGLIKANDPLGLSYKMQEFFEVWNIQSLHEYTLALSLIMIGFEILAGVAVLLGWAMDLFSWLLLLLIVFFTFLTGYAYLSGKIKECGCFGNCIPLTAGESFAKDLLLLALIIFLFIYRKRITAFLPKMTSLIILFFTVVFAVSFQWFVLEYLPVVDCLPFRKGVNILEDRKPPPGSIPDSTAITFIYKKNGKDIEFSSGHFPADFDDSYQFVKRYDKLIRKGNAEAPIKDFNLMTASGNDTTEALLSRKGYTLLMFARDIPDSNPSWNKDFAVLLSVVKMKNNLVYFVTANTRQVEDYFVRNDITNHIDLLKCDVTAIKTAARVNPTLYLLKHGVVLDKWSGADLESAIGEINALPVQEP